MAPLRKMQGSFNKCVKGVLKKVKEISFSLFYGRCQMNGWTGGGGSIQMSEVASDEVLGLTDKLQSTLISNSSSQAKGHASHSECRRSSPIRQSHRFTGKGSFSGKNHEMFYDPQTRRGELGRGVFVRLITLELDWKGIKNLTCIRVFAEFCKMLGIVKCLCNGFVQWNSTRVGGVRKHRESADVQYCLWSAGFKTQLQFALDAFTEKWINPY